MGRKITGIYKAASGYDVDKIYKGQRLRQYRFDNFESAEKWLISEMEKINQIVLKQRVDRVFEDAAVEYLERFADKASISSDVYHLKAVMPFIKDLPLDRVHNGTLRPFIKARKAEGRKDKTVNLSLSIVRRILNLCARDWRDENGITWLAQAPMITQLALTDQRPPRPIMWDEQRRLLPLLADHLAEMALFDLNTGLRDDVVCSLQWKWEVPIPQLGISVFVVPSAHVKGVRGKKTDMVVVCNTIAQSVIEGRRGKHKTHVFTYRGHPIGTMNNTAWQNGRRKAGLGDLHVHDLRHTVGLRMREAGIADRTQDDILWHSNKTMTAHYSMAQVVEIFEALEKIKDETNRWNISLTSLIRGVNAGVVPEKSPKQMKTG